jgi:hypothetical protein
MALMADDDDGNAAVAPAPKRAKAAKKPAADKKKQAAKDTEEGVDRLNTLSVLLDTCEEHGGVDAKTQTLGREIIADGGPVERVEAAIRHLERELSRV